MAVTGMVRNDLLVWNDIEISACEYHQNLAQPKYCYIEHNLVI